MLLATANPDDRADSIRIRRMSEDRPNLAAQSSILGMIARGESGATQECIKQYGGLVWSLARRFSPTDADAEDAVQDIFLDVWKSADRFDPAIASETTFIATIARRRLIDRRRRDTRRITTQAFVDVQAEPPAAPPPAAPATGDSAEDVAAARRAIGTLSEDQQRVLQLSIFQGLSHDRIAQSTGLPLGTVKTHARRGLMRIREIVSADRPSRSTTERRDRQ